MPPGHARGCPAPASTTRRPRWPTLLRRRPAGELADRFPGRLVGTIGEAALPGPDSLVVVVGRSADELSRTAGAVAGRHDRHAVARRLPALPHRHRRRRHRPRARVAAAALLFPLLVLIGTATRLAAARREQRFAAMRLVGATPRQVTVVAAVESTVAAVAGTVVGFGLFVALRAPLSTDPVHRRAVLPGPTSPLTPLDVLVVALGVPAGRVRRALSRCAGCASRRWA